MSNRTILLCAGGTGGHLFPAEAVAHELAARGFDVQLAADSRVQKFADRFPASAIHEIRSATLGSKNPIAIAKTAWSLFSGYRQSRKLFSKIKPVAVAGFGGYPTVPPLYAATKMNIPTLIHESNAVLGRANRILSSRVERVAIGFGETSQAGGLDVTVTGNPVRPAIIEYAKQDYPSRSETDPFELLVFGGSQGAAFFSECLPQAIALLDDAVRARLRIVQQARPEDLQVLVSEYEKMCVAHEVQPFFGDMAERLAASHLVISRAGASTVSELAVMGRPSILVPYPHALDHDQASNAAAVSVSGGSTLYKQAVLSPQILADELTSAVQNPKRLALAAKNAKSAGMPEATAKLADMLEALAG